MPNLKLIYKINQTIIQRKLFSPKERILIAVSGGQDSMYLLSILYRLRLAWNWRLGIIHFDHKWNNKSINQSRQMYRVANNMKIKYYLGIAIATIISEDKARNWRYTLMSKIANLHNYSTLTTGHTASDRIETLLYNTVRGTGLDGLQSLTWKRILNKKISINMKVFKRSQKNSNQIIYLFWFYKKIQFPNQDFQLRLIRPILNITRKEIQQEIDDWCIPKFSDPTNRILNIRRNRIRHQLLPYIRKYFNPRIDYILSNLAEIVHYDLFYLENLVTYIYSSNDSNNLPKQSFYKISHFISIKLLRSFPISIQRRILKKYIYFFTKISLNFEYLEQIRFIIINSPVIQQKTEIDNALYKSRIKHISLPYKFELLIMNNQICIKNNL